MWDSQAEMALSYGLNVSNDQTAAMPALIQQLKDENKGHLPCRADKLLSDELFASRSTTVTLRRADNNANYVDSSGTWLGPVQHERAQLYRAARA